MLNAIRITTNQLEHIQTNLCIHLSYLEDQRNLKIYNKNIFKKRRKKKGSDLALSVPEETPHFRVLLTLIPLLSCYPPPTKDVAKYSFLKTYCQFCMEIGLGLGNLSDVQPSKS